MNDKQREQVGFGATVREARKKRGWSQTELGEQSGLSRPTIARVEANSDVTTATIAKIAHALGLRLELQDPG
ncbi:helix-turn-helix domain-containing protein [Rhodococcus pyridinivorans]|uniref:helix-turn-helix domain-containing protein n=1 Tax=Rhodococcus pyridinivorans TaxID=103816 RepID=UPI001E56EB32|nr:helix-turn-helix transcriptional regulator [Rhodococcus pyridinivorans]MCD5422307.1 helix-turn-helix domain-containing protein [Rhodococcus pyridinivorans]WAL49951.1 helix-turn-helix transcriptional regulator [Rhodococcus pyridinivorans]